MLDASNISGAVVGVGVDLLEIDRMSQAVERWGDDFLDRIFRPSERAYCDSQAVPWRHYAGRFAVKEAVSKALGTGIGGELGWLDMEVLRLAASGAPQLALHGRATSLAAERGIEQILISLSHTRQYAVAQAVAVGRLSKRECGT